MNHNNYQITLWEEFKFPIIVLLSVLFIMIGLHNTFYTFFTVDSSKVNVAWGEQAELPKEQIYVEPVHAQIQAEPVKAYVQNSNSSEQEYSEEVMNEPAMVTDEVSNQNEYVAIDGDISVSAAEFYHPKLSNVVSGNQVSGYLEVQNGEVKGLSVQLNSDVSKDVGIQMITTGESQIQGNIFTYDIDGKNYTATVYPTSPGEYMVSFVNGPWNGARVKFTTQQQIEAPQDQAPIEESVAPAVLSESSAEPDREVAQEAVVQEEYEAEALVDQN